MPPHTPTISLDDLTSEIPEGGLFTGKTWRHGPEPLRLDADDVSTIESLGPVLVEFLRAANDLYYSRDPEWSSYRELLDAGKPDWLLEIHHAEAMRDALPTVIRPDLLLTPDGIKLTEIDSIPGGIGVIDFLNLRYEEAGFDVLSGADRIGRFFVDRDIEFVFSDEACGYRPEIEWMLGNATGQDAPLTLLEKDLTSSDLAALRGKSIYRYFELWDQELTDGAHRLLRASAESAVQLTPPPKAFFEEKLLLAFYWDPYLRRYWEEALSEAAFDLLNRVIPYGWVMSPRQLPPQAVFPKLEVWDLRQIGKFSQVQRRLALKVSGFSEKAWGSRGVHIGHDLPAGEWAGLVDHALASFATSPHILQEFHPSRHLEARYFMEDGSVATMEGVARLSPYYLADGGAVELNGVLAIVCAPDKKKIHGMTDSIFLPCQRQGDEG